MNLPENLSPKRYINKISNSVRKLLKDVGIVIIRTETFSELVYARNQFTRTKQFHNFCLHLTFEATSKAILMYPDSRGENFQDIFAMLVLNERKNGFYVEFGAADGIEGSNTYYMEKKLGWLGILAEPGRCWHRKLELNRTAQISHKCVWSENHAILSFRETKDAGFSTLEMFFSKDRHKDRRTASDIYEVETITLPHLLKTCNAPRVIEYLSIDTEGSELEILRSLNFNEYRPLVVTVEHNYREDRQRIFELMAANGYLRAPTTVSAYDDYYVCKSLEKNLKRIFLPESHLNE